MSSLRFLSLRTMLDSARVGLSKDSRIVKLQKEEFRICKARLIKNQILQNLNQAQSPQKCLGFVSNTTRYKRKTLNTFQNLLEVL